ncbi:MAG: nickel pincer cofactor biosynthesis protein LarC [Candidatus Krumholzibacteria bacterium]|nr:nickel pincer cofactor biosynthesis protein LarC [Candidatus Krumholzibacteria bacterium]
MTRSGTRKKNAKKTTSRIKVGAGKARAGAGSAAVKKNIKDPGMLVIDPAGGLSGDMFLGALFALGVKPAEVQAEVSRLPGLEPFRIVFGRVKRHSISAVRAKVICPEKAHSRDLAKILSMIKRSGLDKKVREMAEKTFLVLGEAEGKIHGMPLERVHFHEVGAVDSIVDIVGAAVALSKLGFPALYHRPFVFGCGKISIAHGRLPVPAPATLEVLKGRTVTFSDEVGEVVTPTGAALMKALAEELPVSAEIVPEKIVYSVGTREKEPGPGMLRVVQAVPASGKGYVVTINTTIDDMSPEIYGYLQERLFEAGALESYVTPVLMKKGRPGSLLTVLCSIENRDRVLGLIFEETTTLGVRVTIEGRAELERYHKNVKTKYGTVAVKFGVLPGGKVKYAPEYEACRRIAIKAGVPVRSVYEEAVKAAGKIK